MYKFLLKIINPQLKNSAIFCIRLFSQKKSFHIDGNVQTKNRVAMTEIRKSIRYAVRLNCKVAMPDNVARAEVVDISKDGARISFPTSGLRHDLWAAKSVSIEGLGSFQVVVRWHAGPLIGVSFKNRTPSLDQFLDEMRQSGQ